MVIKVFLISLVTISCTVYQCKALDFKSARESHQSRALSDAQLKKIVALGDDTQFREILNPILVPRVVGTESHENVKKYLINHMKNLNWQVEEDKFSANTPIGRLNFSNVVARLNPDASRFLVIACHYDSKLMRERSFVGATDSAVPCAMMLHLATSLDGALKKSLKQQDVSLKFIFFDGEEAFQRWGPTDSIYGARHLAQKLAKTAYPPNNKVGTNHLSRMDVFVLLDLIGAPDPTFYSYFSDTERWYYLLVNAEKRLAESKLLNKYSFGLNGYPQHKYFQERSTFAGIEDDHIPFLRKGVPILHLIPSPFPSVWHTEGDNLNALDFNTIANLNRILRVFVAEYLNLEI